MLPCPGRLRRAMFATLAVLLAATALATTVLAIPAPGPTLADARTLSALRLTDGRVSWLRILGERIVYLADYDRPEVYQLYSTPLAGGEPLRLTENLPAGRIERVSVAGERIVFSYRLDGTNQFQLYSVPVAGGAVVKLTPDYSDPGLGSSGFDFLVAGERVVFAVDLERQFRSQLYSVPLSGGQATRLSPEIPTGENDVLMVSAMRASRDNATIVFLMRPHNNPAAQLYVVPTAGGVPTLISAEAPPDSNRQDSFAFTPDGSRVVYHARRDDDTSRIVSVTRSGTELRELSPNGVSFQIAANGDRVVLFAPADQGPTLWSVPIAGGAATALGRASSAAFTLAPTGTTVFFRPENGGLSRVAVGGGSPVELLTGATVQMFSLRFVGDQVFFVAETAADRWQLFVSRAAGAATQLSDPAQSAIVTTFIPAPDGSAVYYVGAPSVDGDQALYRVGSAGGTAAQLSPSVGTQPNSRGAVVALLAVDPAGAALFTQGFDRGTGSGRVLYRVGIDASEATVFDSSRAIVSEVANYVVSAADGRVVYIADQDVNAVNELYSVPLAGGAPIKLNPDGLMVHTVQISPAGGRVLYLATSLSRRDQTQLYSVAIEGGPSVSINEQLPNRSVRQYALTPDGSQLFLLVEPSVWGFGDLVRLPAAGGAAQVLASDVRFFVFDPTGARVLFVTRDTPVSPDMLFSAPIAGGAVVELGMFDRDGPLLISPNGARVVYGALGPFTMPVGLVSQPIAGGAPVPIEGPQTASVVNGMLRFSGDSSTLIVAEALEPATESEALTVTLWRVPVGGGKATVLHQRSVPPEAALWGVRVGFRQAADGPILFAISENVVLPNPEPLKTTLLSVPLAGGDITTMLGPSLPSPRGLSFDVSADGRTALYQTGDGLFRVAADGSQAPVKIAGSEVWNPVFAKNGAIVFTEGRTLFATPPESAAAVQLNQPASTQQVVASFQLAGASVVYRAGIAEPRGGGSQWELFATDLPGPPPPGPKTNKLYLPLTGR